MKKEKLIAVGLAATLALGALPALAFAADPAPGTGTTVSVTTSIDNLSVTVPTTITAEALTGGGALKTVPTNYGITNNSTFKVYVTSAWAEAKSSWSVANDVIAAGTAPTGGKAGTLFLKMAPGTIASVGEGATAWNASATSGSKTTLDWAINGKTGSDGVVFPLTIDATSSTSTLSSTDTSDAVQLFYTVSATKPTV